MNLRTPRLFRDLIGFSRGRAKSHAAFAAGGSARPFGWQTLCATRPDFQSGSGSWAHSAQLPPAANAFAVGSRPATCRCEVSPIDLLNPLVIPTAYRGTTRFSIFSVASTAATSWSESMPVVTSDFPLVSQVMVASTRASVLPPGGMRTS